MLNISEIVAKAEAMFDLFNDHFYAGEMARPAITVSPDGGRGAYGWCTVYEIWQADGQAYREINICAEYINRPISEVAGTMLHEMAHLYNLNHGIKDVSNNGYYHNKKFKETAEAHGLAISHHHTYGWTVTDLTPETAAWIAQQPELSDITANRQATIRIRSTRSGGSRCFLCVYLYPFCGPPGGAGRSITHRGGGVRCLVGLGCWESLRRDGGAGAGGRSYAALDAGSPA